MSGNGGLLQVRAPNHSYTPLTLTHPHPLPPPLTRLGVPARGGWEGRVCCRIHRPCACTPYPIHRPFPCLQNFVYGYPGLRIARYGVLSFTSQQPVLPPLGITGVTLRGMHLFGTAFDFAYDAKTVCVGLQPGGGGPPLELRLPTAGKVVPIPASGPPVCVPVGPVEVAVQGVPWA